MLCKLVERYDKGVRLFTSVVWGLVLVSVLSGCTTSASNLALNEVLTQNERVLQRNADVLAKQSETINMMAAQQTELNEKLQQMQAQIDKQSQTPSKTKKNPLSKVVTSSIASPSGLANGAHKLVLGRYEWLWFDLTKASASAYLDTGRKTSLLTVKSLQRFERDGKDWVRFEWYKQNENNPKTYERPIIRTLSMRMANGKSEKRDVIELKVALGEINEFTAFALTDKETEIPVILGSNFLQDIAVVDVAKKYTQDKR